MRQSFTEISKLLEIIPEFKMKDIRARQKLWHSETEPSKELAIPRITKGDLAQHN